MPRATTGNATKCQCVCTRGEPQQQEEQQLLPPQHGSPAPSTQQLPSLGCHGASSPQKLTDVPAEHLQAEEGWARGRKPSGGELDLAESPPFLLPATPGWGDTCSAVPTEHKHQWESAGVLINALLFMLERKEEEEDAHARLALRQLSRAGTG